MNQICNESGDTYDFPLNSFSSLLPSDSRWSLEYKITKRVALNLFLFDIVLVLWGWTKPAIQTLFFRVHDCFAYLQLVHHLQEVQVAQVHLYVSKNSEKVLWISCTMSWMFLFHSCCNLLNYSSQAWFQQTGCQESWITEKKRTASFLLFVKPLPARKKPTFCRLSFSGRT